MPRPTNEQILQREPELEAGTEQAVEAYRAEFPQATRIINAESIEDDAGTLDHYEVAGGWVDDAGAVHLLTAKISPEGRILESEERPDTPPGHGHDHPRHEKLERPQKERKPVKVK